MKNYKFQVKRHSSFALVILILLLIILIQGCAQQIPPPCNGSRYPCFLTKKGGIPADPTETHNYYATIDPTNSKDTFDKWKAANLFPTDEVSAIYYNAGELNLGRTVHCRVVNQDIPNKACYITNYGPENPSDDVTSWFLNPKPGHALELAISDAGSSIPQHEFTTLAMEYSPPSAQITPENLVRFYVFDTLGDRVETGAQLDSEGIKGIPQICLVCHSGTYYTESHSISDASFLPFVLQFFAYSNAPGYGRARQEENFRKLNLIVMSTHRVPNAPISNLIFNLYSGHVYDEGAKQIDNYVPSNDWSTNQNTKNLYLSFVAPYCRSCHIAISADTSLQFTTYNDFIAIHNNASRIRSDVCGNYLMPQAEIPFNQIWRLGLPQTFLDHNSAFPAPPPIPDPTNPAQARCISTLKK
jgi:hypothetical protein